MSNLFGTDGTLDCASLQPSVSFEVYHGVVRHTDTPKSNPLLSVL